MICEKTFRSRAGKTVILRVYVDGRIEITGDFFTDEDELEKIEEKLSKGEKPDGIIIGVDLDELYEKYMECVNEGKN